MRRLYYGVASVDVAGERNGFPTLKHCNEFFCVFANSQDEAVGMFVRIATEKHKGTLTNAAAFPVPDDMVAEAARILILAGGDT
jgi:hypothetical protein